MPGSAGPGIPGSAGPGIAGPAASAPGPAGDLWGDGGKPGPGAARPRGEAIVEGAWEDVGELLDSPPLLEAAVRKELADGLVEESPRGLSDVAFLGLDTLSQSVSAFSFLYHSARILSWASCGPERMLKDLPVAIAELGRLSARLLRPVSKPVDSELCLSGSSSRCLELRCETTCDVALGDPSSLRKPSSLWPGVIWC